MRFLALLLLASCFACSPGGADSSSGFGGGQSGGSLTESKLTNYIDLYKRLKKEVPDALELVNEHDRGASQHPDFGKLQSIIQSDGMDYEDFVATSSKVGVIYSLSEANMDTYQDITDMSLGGFDESAKSIQEMIDDPDVPEAQKAELRKSLKEVQSGKSQMGNMFNKNREKASKMYAKIRKKLGKVATESEVELVNQYQEQLEEAFSELSRPTIEGSL